MWNMTLTKLFNSLIKHKRTQVTKHWEVSSIVFKMKSTSTNAAPDLDLSQSDVEKIFNIINSKNRENPLQYSINKSCAQNLELHRAHNGPYNSLENLLQVKGTTVLSLRKLHKSIVRYIEVQKRIIRKLVVTPKIIDSNQKDVNTVLGIYVGQNVFSWTLLNRDCEVLQWDFKPMLRSSSKETLLSLLQLTLPIAAMLPKADRYIMQEVETKNFTLNKRSFNFYTEQTVMNTIILSSLTMLHFENEIDFAVKDVFILRQNILNKIYGLIVEHESISTQYVLQKLLQENDESMKSKQHTPSVLINSQFRNMYDTQSVVYQEQIGWPLLIALAFMELIVHGKTDMFDSINI